MKSIVILSIILCLGLSACASKKAKSDQQYAPNDSYSQPVNRNTGMNVAAKMISPAI